MSFSVPLGRRSFCEENDLLSVERQDKLAGHTPVRGLESIPLEVGCRVAQGLNSTPARSPSPRSARRSSHA
jgi:hypothetical protein